MQRVQLGDEPDRAAQNDHAVNDRTEIYAADDFAERQQHVQPELAGHPGHQSKYAKWRERDYDVSQSIHDFRKRFEESRYRLAFFPRHIDGDTQHEGEKNNLQHITRCEGGGRVAGNNVDQRVYKRRRRFRFHDDTGTQVDTGPGLQQRADQ